MFYLLVILALAGGETKPPKADCPDIAPDVLANILALAEKEFVGGSTYGSVLRKIGKWAKAQEPPILFTPDQRKCWLKHVREVQEQSRTDFRKTRWGMTIEEVKATERGSPYAEPNGTLLYLADMHGVPATIAYSFTDGILTMAAIEFPDAQRNADAVGQAMRQIHEQATKEAGKPLKEAVESDTVYTVWQSERTRTASMIFVTTTKMDVTVMYASVKHNTLPDVD